MARNSHFARAFTLIELIVVLAIIAILMSMVYPMYTSMSERAKATKDMSNLRQIGIATQTYLNDNDGILFSPATTWMSQLSPETRNTFPSGAVFNRLLISAPSSEAGDATTPISYGVNANIYLRRCRNVRHQHYQAYCLHFVCTGAGFRNNSQLLKARQFFSLA